jgi:hypothetical protein
MKRATIYRTCLYLITAVNVLASTGYCIAGVIAPYTVLPAGIAASEAGFIFALYAAARTLPLAVLVLYTIIVQKKSALIMLAVLAGMIQFLDGFIGIYEHKIQQIAGPFILAVVQFISIILAVKTAKIKEGTSS